MAGDLRLVPVAAGVWLALLVVLSGAPALIALSLAAAGVGMAIGWRQRRWLVLGIAVAAAVGLGVGGLREHQLRTSLPARLAADQAVAMIELQTTGDAERFVQTGPGQGDLVRVPARTRSISARGEDWAVRASVTVLVTGTEAATWLARPAGQWVRVTARLAPADPGTPTAAVVRIRGPSTVVAEPSPTWQLTGRVRAGLRAAVAPLPTAQRALVPALVVGDTSAMTEQLRAEFQASGLSHLTAVSGANLALMLAFVLTTARWLGVRGWWLRVLGLLSVVAFIGICRTEPSVLRAAAMGLVVLAGLGFGGPAGPGSAGATDAAGAGALSRLARMTGFRALAVAVLVLLLVDPWLSRSAGFALSVLATGGIVALARPWSLVLSRWTPRWLAEAVAVPLSAQLVTQPVVSALSGQISLVGIVANALAGPCVGPATVLGFAAAGVSLVSGTVAGAFGWAAGWVTQVIIWVASVSSALPGAVMQLPTGPLTIALVTLGCLVIGWWTPRLLARPWLVVVVVVLMVLALVRAPLQPGWPPRDWVLVACDVGQGDALVIDLGDGAAVVVDTGPEPELVDRCLDQLGVRVVPLLVLTHFHADHVGGLSGVLDGRDVGLVLVSPMASPAAEASSVRQLIGTEPTARIQVALVGESFDLAGLHWETLGPAGSTGSGVGPTGTTDPPAPPPAAEDAESSEQNDGSIVGLATVADGRRPLRILFTGDVEPDGQQAILSDLVQRGADPATALNVDVLKVPHHGSSRQEQAFLAATGARIAITSSGVGNSYGHPAAGTVHRLELLGMTVLQTDQHGGVAVWVRGGDIGAAGQR